jgi:NADH dehydrogenase [ubiquinone] 1 alpha subcomplex assembly factor 3
MISHLRFFPKSLKYSSRLHRTLSSNSLGKFNDVIEVEDLKSVVKGFGDRTFQINNVVIRQPVLVFPSSYLSWNVDRLEDITIEKLRVFSLLFPTLDLLLIGCGETVPPNFSPSIRKYFRDQGIMLEITTTAHAASTFNILNGEGRNVAAALLTIKPPEFDSITE